MFELEPGLIIWTTVSFSILVFLLYRFLMPPLFSIIEKRELQIKASIENAEQVRLDAEKLLLAYKKKLEDAQLDANKVIENSKTESLAMIKEATELAKHEAHIILDQAKQEIESNRKKMMKELKEIGAELIVSAATKVLEREVKENDNSQIIAESLNAIG